MRGAAASAGGATIRHINRSSEEKSAQEEPAIEDATAAQGTEATSPVRAQAVIKTKPATVATRKDADVPGCGPGMICTVCIAGCTGAVNVIVHAAPKQK